MRSEKAGPLIRRTTMEDVAAALQVAVSTVSNAYNRPDQLSAALRARVLAKATELGYAGPDPTARGLRTRASGQIAVLLGRPLAAAFADPVLAAHLEGITAGLSAAGFGLTLVPTAARVPLPIADGVIALGPDRAEPELAAVLRHQVPMVLVDHPAVGRNPAIVGDDEAAARGVLGHVLGLGHTRIAIVLDRLVASARPGRVRPAEIERATWSRTLARLRGYRAGVEAAGLLWRTVPVYSAGTDTEVAGQAIADLVLQDVPTPTVVLCAGDRIAAGIMTAARQAEIAVPDALSIVGFDDTPLARLTVPPLTSVRLAHVETGRAAAEALLALLRGETPPGRQPVAPKIVVRGSLRGPKTT